MEQLVISAEKPNKPKRNLKPTLKLQKRENFHKYGIRTFNIIANGHPWNKYQYIQRKDTPIAILSNKYQVLPNETVIEKADKIAQKLGAKPFVFRDRNWFKNYEVNEHVLASKNLASMSALYLFRENVDITGNGDTVNLGYSVANAIDGSRSFSVAIFSFRKVCGNFMLHLHSEKMLKVIDGSQVKSGLRLNETQTLASLSKRHTKSLNTKIVTPAIKAVIKSADEVIRRYRTMNQLKLLERQATQIVNYMPKKLVKTIPYIDVNEDTNEVSITETVSQWTVFNTLTEAISHGKGSYNSTMNHLKSIDTIFAVAS